MHVARPLLLLLAFALTHKTDASQRERSTREAFTKLAAAEAARCLREKQDSLARQESREICSRPGIQRVMAEKKEREKKFKAQIDPKYNMLMSVGVKRAPGAHASGYASVGRSGVVVRSRIEALVNHTSSARNGASHVPFRPNRQVGIRSRM